MNYIARSTPQPLAPQLTFAPPAQRQPFVDGSVISRLGSCIAAAMLVSCVGTACPEGSKEVAGRCVPQLNADASGDSGMPASQGGASDDNGAGGMASTEDAGDPSNMGGMTTGGKPVATGATTGSMDGGGKSGTGGMPETSGVQDTGGMTGTGGILETGGAQGTGGMTSTGGVQSTGGQQGTGGVASTGGIMGTGGVTGTGGAMSCGPGCVDPTPICDTTSGTCVECVEDVNCSGAKCLDGSCVECISNSDCGNPGDATPVCQPNHTCGPAGKATADVCEPCVADSQCQSGQLCVMQTFGVVGDVEDVGYFCAWRVDAPVPGPDGVCGNSTPYLEQINSVTSINGTTANVCTLGVTTCPALNDYGKSCEVSGQGDSSVCGFAHSNENFATGANVDAYCVNIGVSGAIDFICAPICNAGPTSACDSGQTCTSFDGGLTSVCAAN